MAKQLPFNGYVLGLDVGAKRIGTALASVIAQLPQPTEEVVADDFAIDKILEIVQKEDVQMIVVGLPRNLQGEETSQSEFIRKFASDLKAKTNTPVVFADESLSSARADDLMKQNEFKNVSQDSLAACFILEEFFANIEDVPGGA